MNATVQVLPSPVPPHNIEAEQALLGAILINNDAFYRVVDYLEATDFFEAIHRRIFTVIGDLVRVGKKATPVTLKSFLPGDMDVAGLSLNQYLARLAAEATTIINARDYADTIKDHALRRAMIVVAQDLIAQAWQPDARQPASELVTAAITELDSLSAGPSRDMPAVSLNEALASAVDAIASAYQRDGAIAGITWGLRDLDAKTLGLHRGEMVVLGGRPGMGKSAIAVGVATAAAEAGHGVVMASLEMSAQSLAHRTISERLAKEGHRLSYHFLRSGKFNESDFEFVCDAAKWLGKLPIIIDEHPLVAVAQIPSRLRRARRRLEAAGATLDLFIVDYMQLLAPGDRYRGERVNEVTEISAALKRIARQENVAVMALSQLSRKVEERANKHPILADLRESGSIEQDADTVIFLYRESYYVEQSKPPEANKVAFADWLLESERAQNKLECIIAKQRHGPTGTVDIFFDPATNSVRDLELSAVDNARLGY